MADKLHEIEKFWAEYSAMDSPSTADADIAWLIAKVKQLRRELALYLADEEE